MGTKKNKCNQRNYPFLYNKYPRYREIQCYLRMLARQFPNRIRLECIGQTLQGRDIDMIVIAKDIRKQRVACLIDAGIHAREWLSNTSALYFIDHLIRNPKINNYMDFYVIPCLNPDGYEFTHTEYRLWRKNMNTNGSKNLKCHGVDLNRNFPYRFGKTPGSSKCFTRFDYRGKYPLSEPESRSLANIFSRYRRHLRLYISLHCYGNVILFPWGHTEAPVDDRADLVDCGCACREAMEKNGKDRHFKVGSLASCMYLTSGSSVDYARGCHNLKFAYTIELQKGGKSGFTPSTKKIFEIGKEVAHGINAMAKYVHKYYKKREASRSKCKTKRVRFSPYNLCNLKEDYLHGDLHKTFS